ncbi:MAG: carboxypeptidase-like regulatory domain-containing protein [Flavisolibacter sp.]
MKWSSILFYLLLTFSTYGQKVIKGVVVDGDKGKPIPNASVFLNTTSVGAVTNAEGTFELTIPNGRFDLIVSSIGYETYSQTISPGTVPGYLAIRLKLKSQLMQTVIVEPYEKDGWEKWGKFFLENFIGTSAYALNCKIKNTGVIHFRNSKKKNELTAIADEPLIIENKALGYTLQYQLENFSYNFKSHYLLYTGYPFFLPMKGGAGKQKRWEKRRSEAYFGSLMHFMRSVYRNKIAQENFEVRHLQKIPNNEKQRVKAVYSTNQRRTKKDDGTMMVTTINQDTANYYDKILAQEDYKDIIGRNLLPGDSIAYGIDSITAAMDFKNYLLVIYKNKLAPLEYRQQYPKSSTAMMSQIVLINQRAVEIEANGSYYDPVDLMSTGYWAWSEKMAMMLPFDYVPPKR